MQAAVHNETQGLVDMLNGLERQRFFGTIELKYEAGRVVYLRRSETIKLPGKENCRDNRGQYDDHPQQR